jgi:hypothetical protein
LHPDEEKVVMHVESMKKFVLCCTALLAIFAFNTARSMADSPKDSDQITSSAITAQYSQINDAIVNHNLDRLMSFYTDDFTEINATGSIVNRDEERKAYQDELNRIKSMQIHYDVENCISTPTGTYCDVHFHMDGVGYKRILFLKINGTFSNDLTVHDLWVSTPVGIRIKSRQTIYDETKVAAN